MDIFDLSLLLSEVPTSLKWTTIILVTKNSKTSCLNDYRPVALASNIMKCVERLTMEGIKCGLTSCLHPLQFAYCHNRSTADAITLALHSHM